MTKRITKINKVNAFGLQIKTRVAAYCRVSTSSDEQLVSLETQKAHYESYIQANDEWQYVGLYYDEGITGTKKDKRPGLMELIQDCEAGKIDHIITKSISRFSRNTTDCLEMIRRLLELDVTVLFEKENINTGTMDSELMLSILSGMAESESVSISQNSKWSIKKRFEKGTFVISYPPYGYENIAGVMVIDPLKAKVVERIYQEALAGLGTRAIAKVLNESGIPARKGGEWSAGTINGILSNEKYTGDVVFQKTFTDGSFNRHKNKGELNQYLVENHHEAIISHEDFDKVQSILNFHGKEKGIVKDEGKYQRRYAFSGKIKCGECGSIFKRRMHYKPSGPYVAWCCSQHIEDRGSCTMKFIRDEAIKEAFVIMMQKLEFSQKQVLKPFVEKLGHVDDRVSVLQMNELDAKLEKNVEQRQILVGLMTSGVLEPAVFNQEKNNLDAEARMLKDEKEKLCNGVNRYIVQAKEAHALLKYLSKSELPDKFDAALFEEFVEEIKIVSREQIIFILKCGLQLKDRLVD